MAGQTAPGSAIPSQPTNGGQPQRMIPFRMATNERSEILPSEAGTITAAQQPIERTMEGTGFLYGVNLNETVTTAANAAATTFAEDGPWSGLASVVLRDPTGEIVNLSGFNLFLYNLAMRQYAVRNTEGSTEVFTATTGAGATGGSFNIWLRVPAGINRRSLLGILGNQDRSVKYQLRTDVGFTTSIYGVAPTNPGTFAIQKIMESYAVPSPVGAMGPQQIIPDNFGTLAFATSTVSEAAPVPSATINHYMRRIGNTIRFIILVFRAGAGATPRTVAQANPPSRIQLKIGDSDFFNEPYAYRRMLMFERYGFDWPAGVVVYDMMHDFSAAAGFELGDDWLNTMNVNTAQWIITYPAGFTAGGSLTFVTADMALVGQPLGS